MSLPKIYIQLSEDLREILADNDLSIRDILDQADIDAEVTHESPPIEETRGSRTRDLLTVVQIALEGSGAILALSLAITNVLNTLYRKPIYETYTELEEIRDENGKILLDENGRPIMKEVRKHVLLEPGTGKRSSKFNLKTGIQGMILGYATEEDDSGKQ